MIVKATVIALKTEDGLCEFEPHVQVGQTYLVDLTTIRRQAAMGHRREDGSVIHHQKDIIFLALDDDTGWLPLDLLKLEA